VPKIFNARLRDVVAASAFESSSNSKLVIDPPYVADA
jgi:hypothetical protein